MDTMSGVLRKSIKVRAFHKDSTLRPTNSVNRKIQVVKKVKESRSIDDSIEKDFLYERGDPSLFLNPSKSRYELLGYTVVKDPYKIRQASNKNLQKLESRQQASVRSGKEFHKHFNLRPSYIPKKEEDSKIELESQIKIINDRIKNHKQTKPKTFKSDSNFLFRQERSLNRFDFAKNKWEKIEKGLMSKLKRKHEELIGMKRKQEYENSTERLPNWTTSLRSNPDDKKFYEFIPVGNKLSGIFIRDIVSYSPEVRFKTKSCPDLSIAGLSKLPMEIMAVKNTGGRILNETNTYNCNKEEVFAEDYGRRLGKYLNN